MFFGMQPLSLLRLEYDTLVSFEPVPGPNGLRLVPDLALQVPVPGDGGRSYSFRLRPGIRYSNGELLKASDFRRGLERLFEVGSPGADYYSGLVGAQACAAHPENCSLAQAVVTDDRSGLVVFHLSAPDPDFLDKLTPNAFGAPIPSGTPDRDMVLRPLPAPAPTGSSAPQPARWSSSATLTSGSGLTRPNHRVGPTGSSGSSQPPSRAWSTISSRARPTGRGTPYRCRNCTPSRSTTHHKCARAHFLSSSSSPSTPISRRSTTCWPVRL